LRFLLTVTLLLKQVGKEYAIKRATLKKNAYDDTKELSLGKATTVQDL
jgi:hypothetical protein